MKLPIGLSLSSFLQMAKMPKREWYPEQHLNATPKPRKDKRAAHKRERQARRQGRLMRRRGR